MKKILFVSPASYPLYGAESIVNLKLLKAMTKSGDFTIDLISKRNKDQQYGENSLSDLGIKLNSIHIVEVDNKINIKTIWGHIMCFLTFGIVFRGSHWAYSVLKIAKTLVKENSYDYVLTKSLAAPLVGYYLKKEYGLKWVATWNDPYPDCLYPEIYARMLNAKFDMASKSLIKIIHDYADVHIFPSARLRDHLLPFFKVPKEKTVIIPHVVNTNNSSSKIFNISSPLKIIHSGNIAYPRDPEIIMEGLKLFYKRNSGGKIVVDILGKTDENLDEIIKRKRLDGIVNVIPPVSYIESLELLSSYHVALILEAKLNEGIFLPTKVSDFMQSGMAIFAISPSVGVLKDLYENNNIGYFADNTSPESVCIELERLYNDFQNNTIVPCKIPFEYTEEYIIGVYQSF